MNQKLRESLIEFKKELTWNNTKIMICVGLPTALYLYCYSFWLRKLTELLNSQTYSHPKTVEQSIISLCIVCGIIAPLWLTPIILSVGAWLGKNTRFFVDNKTRRIVWDDKEYFIRDMLDEERNKIESLLSPYKSKLQIKKEKLADKSWLRRNFT